MKKFKSLILNARHDQKGLASIVVVGVLVVLLTLVSIGFSRLMSRTLNNTLNNQQSLAADYAARSGLNDVIQYVKANPATESTNCNSLIGTASSKGPFYDKSNLSGDKKTAYTCILVSSKVDNLNYQQLQPSKSQLITLTTQPSPVDKLMISWQATDRNKTQFPLPVGSKVLFDEATWTSNNYGPMLRVTLYPVPANKDISPTGTKVQNFSKTFFFYPNSVAAGVTAMGYSTTDGTIQPVNCASKESPETTSNFNGTADLDCNVVITGLSATLGATPVGYYVARVTPLYSSASVRIKANSNPAGSIAQFIGVQSTIDVTAKSGSNLKRLQARVAFSSSGIADSFPEYAIRSANAICKRLAVGTSITIESPYCNLTFSATQPAACDPCQDTGCGGTCEPSGGSDPCSASPVPPECFQPPVCNLTPMSVNGRIVSFGGIPVNGRCDFYWSYTLNQGGGITCSYSGVGNVYEIPSGQSGTVNFTGWAIAVNSWGSQPSTPPNESIQFSTGSGGGAVCG